MTEFDLMDPPSASTRSQTRSKGYKASPTSMVASRRRLQSTIRRPGRGGGSADNDIRSTERQSVGTEGSDKGPDNNELDQKSPESSKSSTSGRSNKSDALNEQQSRRVFKESMEKVAQLMQKSPTYDNALGINEASGTDDELLIDTDELAKDIAGVHESPNEESKNNDTFIEGDRTDRIERQIDYDRDHNTKGPYNEGRYGINQAVSELRTLTELLKSSSKEGMWKINKAIKKKSNLIERLTRELEYSEDEEAGSKNNAKLERLLRISRIGKDKRTIEILKRMGVSDDKRLLELILLPPRKLSTDIQEILEIIDDNRTTTYHNDDCYVTEMVDNIKILQAFLDTHPKIGYDSERDKYPWYVELDTLIDEYDIIRTYPDFHKEARRIISPILRKLINPATDRMFDVGFYDKLARKARIMKSLDGYTIAFKKYTHNEWDSKERRR
jgi:hypothetical protein